MPTHDGDSDLPRKEPLLPTPGIFLWGGGRADLADPVNPPALAGVDPLWAEDALACAPWQELLSAGESWWFSRQRAPGRVVVCGPCSSSLDVARLFAGKDMLSPWDSVLAVSQRAGRGQLGRSWESPPGNVYGALLLPPVPKEWDDRLSLLVGFCLVRFLRSKNIPACIKWPNDLLVAGVKVAGVLIEEREGRCMAGIGINLTSCPPKEMLRAGHAAPAGHLRQLTGFMGAPLGVWRDLVDFVRVCYETVLAREAASTAASLIKPFMCGGAQ